MDMSVSPREDYCHALGPDEHEVFYFVFGSQDGEVFGILRLLLGREIMLELGMVRIGEYKGSHLKSQPWSMIDAPTSQAVGNDLTLDCLEPWQQWRIRVERAEEEQEEGLLPLLMDLTFHAVIPPARFPFGPFYQQVQQGGRLTGSIQVGEERWEGELLCYRDHSWGRRTMRIVKDWTILTIPDRLYAVIVTLPDDQLTWFGRVIAADGQSTSLVAPELTSSSIQDPQVGMEKWTFERLTPPSVWYLGKGGNEFVRSEPQPGDLFKDEIGLAVFTSSEGERVVGFIERADVIML